MEEISKQFNMTLFKYKRLVFHIYENPSIELEQYITNEGLVFLGIYLVTL